jgi:hypothetical protein
MQILLNGKERTEDEFNQLLLNAELKLNRVISTESTLRIFEAVI